MGVARLRCQAERGAQRDLAAGRREQVVAAQHLVDALVGVVHHHRQLVGHDAVAAAHDEVPARRSAPRHRSVHRVVEGHRALGAEAQRRLLARGQPGGRDAPAAARGRCPGSDGPPRRAGRTPRPACRPASRSTGRPRRPLRAAAGAAAYSSPRALWATTSPSQSSPSAARSASWRSAAPSRTRAHDLDPRAAAGSGRRRPSPTARRAARCGRSRGGPRRRAGRVAAGRHGGHGGSRYRAGRGSRLLHRGRQGQALPALRRAAAGRPLPLRRRRPGQVPGDGVLRVRREKGGRGGKTVTTVSGAAPADARDLAQGPQEAVRLGRRRQGRHRRDPGRPPRQGARATCRSRGASAKAAGDARMPCATRPARRSGEPTPRRGSRRRQARGQARPDRDARSSPPRSCSRSS